MPSRCLLRRVICVLALVTVAACTKPTPYAPATHRDGFADLAIEDNRYRISFAGNSSTSRDVVETYLLYRAAEVTLASGHDWFRIADRETEIETRFHSVATGFGGTRFYRSGFRGPFVGGLATTNTRPINRYQAFTNILVFDGDKPTADPQAYDARSVIATLEPLIVRPEDG